MKTATIILLGSISCLVGCDSKTCSDGNASNPPARPGYFVSTNIVDIKENIRLMCDSLAKKGATAEFYGLIQKGLTLLMMTLLRRHGRPDIMHRHARKSVQILLSSRFIVSITLVL